MYKKTVIVILSTLSSIFISASVIAANKEQSSEDQLTIKEIVTSEVFLGGLAVILVYAGNYAVSKKVGESIRENISPILSNLVNKIDHITEASQDIKMSLLHLESKYSLVEKELENIKEKLNEQKKEYTDKINKIEKELNHIEQIVSNIKSICPIE